MADSFSLLVNDSSPLLSYYPFADTLSTPNFFEGWNPCFSTSACSTFPGQQGNGSSFHVTSKDGAAFSIKWWGTQSRNFFLQLLLIPSVGNGIQLSGIAAGSITYDLQLDGSTNSSISPSTSGRMLLGEYDGLQPGDHTLSLIVHNPTNSTSALIAIDHALITINSTSPKYVPRRPRPLVLPRATDTADTDYSRFSTTFSNSVTDDTSLPFTGQWSFLNNSSLSPLDDTYHTTTHAGDFLNFNFSGAFASTQVSLPLTVHPHHYH
jgi:hypothetical protein